MRVFPAIACLVGLVGGERPVEACSCQRASICDAFWEADVVFVGRATDVASKPAFHTEVVNGKQVTVVDGQGAQAVTFAVTRQLRGVVASTQQVRVAGGPCASPLSAAEEYFVYAKRVNAELVIDACSFTKPLSDAADDLAFVRQLPTKQTMTVSGPIDTDDGPPTPNALVTVPGTRLATRADRQGWFTIELPPHGATLELSERGVHAARVVVEPGVAGQCKQVTIAARWTGVVRGRVVDDRGAPVANLAMAAAYDGRYHGFGKTAADGTYAITNLRPGATVTVTTESGSPRVDKPWPEVAYGKPVVVPQTGTVDRIDIAMPARRPAFDSTITVRDARGFVGNATVTTHEAGRAIRATTDSRGRAIVRHLAGTFEIEACARRRGREVCAKTERALRGPTQIDLRLR